MASHTPAHALGKPFEICFQDKARVGQKGTLTTEHALKVPENITQLKLPPCSPEINSPENVWQYLHRNHLANRIFETCNDIVDACCKAWNALIALPNTITSVGNRRWIEMVLT